jgi:hypothetical protein
MHATTYSHTNSLLELQCKAAARLLLLLGLLFAAGATHAQGNSGATPPPSFVLDQCKHEVMTYQKNLETLRKNLGDKAAQEFADKFMTKEQWNESLLRDGYCSIARGLKAARLL